MESNGAKLVERRGSSDSCLVLSFRASAERVLGSRSSTAGSYSRRASSSETATTQDYVAYGGLFFVELCASSFGAELQAIGLPVIEGQTACPKLATRYVSCSPVPASGGRDFADGVQRWKGISVKGRQEAELLTGLLAQLQRKQWQDVFRAARPFVTVAAVSAPPDKTAIVAVLQKATDLANACYDPAVEPNADRGMLMPVSFQIDAGHVVNSSIGGDTFAHLPTSNCLLMIINRLEFPLGGKVEVSFNWRFNEALGRLQAGTVSVDSGLKHSPL